MYVFDVVLEELIFKLLIHFYCNF